MPTDRTDLTKGGKLEVLQVFSRLQQGQPIVFHDGKVDQDILSPDRKDLHVYGESFSTQWVTIHDTAVDGTRAFDANALAKKAGGTPFKRPENGDFRPGVGFRQFYFDETGDTNLLSEAEAGADYGSDGSVYSLTQSAPTADTGTLRLLYRGDPQHNGFDNVTFLSKDQLVAVEDAGSTVHTQRNGLDQGYVLNLRDDYGHSPAYGATGGPAPLRMIAEGRDPLATTDALLIADSATNGFQNEDDNELTEHPRLERRRQRQGSPGRPRTHPLPPGLAGVLHRPARTEPDLRDPAEGLGAAAASALPGPGAPRRPGPGRRSLLPLLVLDPDGRQVGRSLGPSPLRADQARGAAKVSRFRRGRQRHERSRLMHSLLAWPTVHRREERRDEQRQVATRYVRRGVAVPPRLRGPPLRCICARVGAGAPAHRYGWPLARPPSRRCVGSAFEPGAGGHRPPAGVRRASPQRQPAAPVRQRLPARERSARPP